MAYNNHIPDSIRKYEPIDGRWEFHSQIGEGAFGKVYKMVDRSGEKEEFLALKILHVERNPTYGNPELFELPDIDDQNDFFQKQVASIMEEIFFMYSLCHCENIVKIYKHFIFERSDNRGVDALILMELLTPITTHFSTIELLEHEVLKMGIHICAALEHCAKLGVIHRDIKPGNIFVSAEGVYKLGDFGIAEFLAHTKCETVVLGSHNYVAPEVYMGKPYDSRADLYSLGLVLYQLLNNHRLPFLSESPSPISMQEMQRACYNRMTGKPFPPPRYASREFSSAIIKATYFSEKDRYQSASQFKSALNLITIKKGAPLPYEITHSLDDMSINRTALIISSFEKPIENNEYRSEQKGCSTSHKYNVPEAAGNTFATRIIVRMINWFGFTCLFSLVPVFIYLLFYTLLSVELPLIDKLTAEFLYFGLAISVITIREMVSLELWKKAKSIYLIALLIMLLVLILSSIFFGIMILNELNVLHVILVDNTIFWGAIVLGLSSLITGTIIQIWEEM